MKFSRTIMAKLNPLFLSRFKLIKKTLRQLLSSKNEGLIRGVDFELIINRVSFSVLKKTLEH